MLISNLLIMDTWTLPEAANALNLKVGRLREWYDRGQILPTRPVNRGETYQFVIEDLYRIKLFEYLCNRGFYRDEVKEIVAGYKNEPFLAVIKTGERITYNWYKKGDAVKLQNEDDIYIVNLDKIRKSIKFKVKKAKVVIS